MNRADIRQTEFGERGASLALTALSLAWIVGLASLVVDIGDGWLIRQQLIPATDAAALAAAQDLVDRPWDDAGACATAGAFVFDNSPTAALTECAVSPLGGSPFGASGGWVSVTATEDLDPFFGELTTGAGRVHSVSTAAWGPPLTVSGLRPLGLCYDGSLELRELIDDPPATPTWVEVPYVKADPEACGGSASAGNFATIDFDGGAGVDEIEKWTLEGYPQQIGFEPPTVSNCDGGVTCYERPYASQYITGELYSLRTSGRYAAFPVFDYADTDEIHLIGLIRARLYAFDFAGPPETWRMELKVEPGLITGTCCGPSDVSGGGMMSGNKVIAICGVDPAAFEACRPTDPAVGG